MVDTDTREVDSRQMLSERRRDIEDDVQRRIRSGRTDKSDQGRDDIDVSDAVVQEDIAFALLQMRTDTLSRIDEALLRLRRGDYGSCVACGPEIAERRLRALPFAVRCQTCEEQREQLQERGHQLADQQSTLFQVLVGALTARFNRAGRRSAASC